MGDDEWTTAEEILRQRRQDIARDNVLSQQEAIQLFRTLAETTESAIFMFRGDHNIYVNEAACDNTGYTRAELLGMPFWQLIRADYQALVRERGMARQQSEAVETHYEVPIVAKNGEGRWLQFAGNLIDYQGERAVLGMAIDITARKLSEDALRESEQKFRTLAEVTPAGILIMDRAGLGRPTRLSSEPASQGPGCCAKTGPSG